MTTHLSARVAWHDSGWNGHICRNPAANTYCVGQYSFPGDTIAKHRDLNWEQADGVKGQPIGKLDNIPPCMMSVNAFGAEALRARNAPPSWFKDQTETKEWQMPPHTVATWPYEEMYRDEVLNPPGTSPKYNPVKRRQFMQEFFAKIQPQRSLIFYYANYSNPFSENDQLQYVIVGVSRIKAVGPELSWLNQSEKTLKQYGPMVWFRNITSNYPDEGLRLPYQAYLDRPDVLESILFVPDNPRSFKYATRHISDDGALGLIERLREIVGYLQDLGDKSENWPLRQEWLAGVMAELWHNRGLYPGLGTALDYLKFSDAIPYAMRQVAVQGEQTVKDSVFSIVEGKRDNLPDLGVPTKQLAAVRKKWQDLDSAQRVLLRDVLPRFDLQTKQIEIVLDQPEKASLYAAPSEMSANPYILSEQFVGSGPDDLISFSQVDHGLFPSPELGAELDFERDGWQRLRALSVDQLKRVEQHTFQPASTILETVNRRLGYVPEWKRAQFKVRQLENDQINLEGALKFRYEGDQLYLYLKYIFEDERQVEKTLRQLVNLPDIAFRKPVIESDWRRFLTDVDSPLYKQHPDEYEKAISEQVEVCQRIFRRPLSVLCGAAGTGKTTVVKALIQAIEQAHGSGTSFQLLAPTGKAADRLRERTGKAAATIHSFLSQRGWLNDNFTFKPAGGKREDGITTYIIDEASMLDLPLLATLFRAINWNSVQRLIFVGDANQLPPIGTGKVFADLIDWLREQAPTHVGELTTNMRNKLNELQGKGTGILDLASLYVRRDLATYKSADQAAFDEELLGEIQRGGTIRGDLRILYWQTAQELETQILETIVQDMQEDLKATNKEFDPNRRDQLWEQYWRNQSDQAQGNTQEHPERNQVISPYRGELFGVEHLNQLLQKDKNGWWLEHKGALGGITFKDKVIQIINRPASRPLWAYNTQTGKSERAQVFNGEIGVTKIHGFDSKKWKWEAYHVDQFQVIFSRKPNLWYEYNSDSMVEENLELAYAISVHKAQGSEFERLYFVLPKHKRALLSRELFYTGITRAQVHSTLFVQEDMAPLLSLRRPENSYLARINSSLFAFRPVEAEFQRMNDWYVEGRIHRTLTNQMVRSKSEVIVANMLADREIPFEYEVPLYSPIDGTFYLPDFTINLRGEQWFWEHLGMLHDERYRSHWAEKEAWYKKNGFWDHVIVSQEVEGFDSSAVHALLVKNFGDIQPVASSQASASAPDPVAELRALIAKGESGRLEFKETLEIDTKTGNKLPSLIQSVLKTIAAYLNTDGGILLIGISNDGEIAGLERDFHVLGKSKNADGFELKLRDLISQRFAPVPFGQINIEFVATPNGAVCRIQVQPSLEIIHCDEAIYVRDGNRTIKLEGRQLTEWLMKRARK